MKRWMKWTLALVFAAVPVGAYAADRMGDKCSCESGCDCSPCHCNHG